MPDAPPAFAPAIQPTAALPLSGITMLAVEDSRYASEALRLMCLHSGARLRRADCLASARRHLQVYRPEAVIIDLGLPDGPGETLISDLSAGKDRPPVILGTSGDPSLEASARAAGADGFLPKPVESLRTFQNAILEHLSGVPRLRPGAADTLLRPDEIALHDDLCHVEGLLADRPDATTCAYASRFLAGLARSARDAMLAEAADGLRRRPDRTSQDVDAAIARVKRLVRGRLSEGGPLWISTPAQPGLRPAAPGPR